MDENRSSRGTELLEEERQDQPSQEAGRKPGLSTADLAGSTRQAERRDEAARERDRATSPAADTAVQGEAAAEERVALLPEQEIQGFRSRWEVIQTGFVDSPRQAVEQADGLVAEVMQRLAEVFASERADLEGQWSRGEDASTEDLRQALRRYRSFFGRLLSI